MDTPNPRKRKRLGRKIRGFDRAAWKRERANTTLVGNYAQFKQNLNKDTIFCPPMAEASPFDNYHPVPTHLARQQSARPSPASARQILREINTSAF